MGTTECASHREPWNKRKIVGQKAPFKLKDIWALRVADRPRHGQAPLISTSEGSMQTLNEMLAKGLLTPSQHLEIGCWIAHAKTPEGIMAMPPHLWKPFELASVLMTVDADLMQPPLMAK